MSPEGDDQVSRVEVLQEQVSKIEALLDTHCRHCSQITQDILDRLSKGATKMALHDQKLEQHEEAIRVLKEGKRDRDKQMWGVLGGVAVTLIGVIANLLILLAG